MAQDKEARKRHFCGASIDPRDVAVLAKHAAGTEAFIFDPEPDAASETAPRRAAYPQPKTKAERKYRRLLGKLKRMNLCASGDALNQRGVLFWAANYLRLIDIERDESTDAKLMRRQLNKIAPQSSGADVDAAVDYASKHPPIEHDRRKVGIDTDLRMNRWFAVKHPADVLPCNRTDEQIKDFFRQKENSRGRHRRREAGAKPRRLSNVALAAKYGCDRGSIARWIKAGILCPVTGEWLGVPRRGMPQIRPAPYIEEEPFVGSEVDAGGRKCGIEPARPAAPIPQEEDKDAMPMPPDNAMPEPAAGGPLRGLAPHGPSSLNPTLACPQDDAEHGVTEPDLPQDHARPVGARTAACPSRAAEPPPAAPAETAADDAERRHGSTPRVAVPMPDPEDDDEFAREVEAREREKAAYRAERTQGGRSPPCLPDGPSRNAGRTERPRRPIYSALDRGDRRRG